jgi:TfoX/Sxy family transcriptional regulator of competence genes
MAMKWIKAPPEMMARFERMIPADPRIERRKMFGYPCTFVRGNMQMGLFQTSMNLRLSEEDRSEFLKLPGASIFAPMAGRPMREYVVVPDAVFTNDRALSDWIARSVAYVASLPAKAPKAKGKTAGGDKGAKAESKKTVKTKPARRAAAKTKSVKGSKANSRARL